MSHATIVARLKAELATVAAMFTPDIPVAWDNRDYVPDGRYMAAAIVPAQMQRLTIDGHHRASGSLVVTIASRTNVGTGEGLGIADAVVAAFPCDAKMTTTDSKTIRITETPSIRQGYQDGGWWRTPVVIPWEVI